MKKSRCQEKEQKQNVKTEITKDNSKNRLRTGNKGRSQFTMFFTPEVNDADEEDEEHVKHRYFHLILAKSLRNNKDMDIQRRNTTTE